MCINARALEQARKKIMLWKGATVTVRANRGRKRIGIYEATIEEAYSNLFTMSVAGKKGVQRIAYTYADMLLKNVILSLPENGEENAECKA